MIPKIIHYCWLSGEPFPESVQKCMATWKAHLPDYELILWDYNRFPRGKSKWVDQAFDCHKYAFAADYIRIYALYNFGGIYLDSDVEVLKSYNDLLELPYFIGQEKTPSGIEAATMGFDPHNPLLYELLLYYEGRDFIKSNNELDVYPLPFIIRRCIESLYEYHVISNINNFDNDNNVFNVFTSDFFSPKHYSSQEIKITPNTYSIHQFEGAWVEKEKKTKENVTTYILPNKKKCFKSFLKKIFHYILRLFSIKKNIVIISNGDIEKQCCYLLGIEDLNPFKLSKITKESFEKFVNIGIKGEFGKKIEFISIKESKIHLYKNDFYPVGKIKDTDIEFHFVNHFSREQIRGELDKFDNSIKDKSIIYILQKKHSITRWDVYKTCLKINFTCNRIILK